MGEARRKFEADSRGVARPRDGDCPACHSRRLHMIPRGQLGRFNADADWQGCIDCHAVWEPFPLAYVRDPVCAEPCDNCAFRPGSPEQENSKRWRSLLESLKPSGNYSGLGGHFFCHKGVPIDLSKGPGNFSFPQRPVLLDGEPITRSDGSVATTEDTARMRTCSGFLRMLWALNAKAEVSA